MKISPADTAFSNCVKKAANNTCVKCGVRRDRMECSHIFGRRHRTIRWCKENAVCKCTTCHRWWHENPTESGVWFIEKYGQGIMDILTEKRNQRVKVTKLEEKDIAKHYRRELKLLENGATDFASWQ